MSDAEHEPEPAEAAAEPDTAVAEESNGDLDLEAKFRELELEAEAEDAERERRKKEPEPVEQEERDVDPKELEKDLRLQYNLGENDIAELKEAFAMFQNNNALPSYVELGNTLRSLRQNPSEQEIKDLWNDSYLNEAGGMELYEYIRIVGKRGLRGYADMMEELEEALRVFDKDGSGFIPKEEFRQIMMTMGEPVDKSDTDEMFRTMEMTTDGKIIVADIVNKLTSK